MATIVSAMHCNVTVGDGCQQGNAGAGEYNHRGCFLLSRLIFLLLPIGNILPLHWCKVWARVGEWESGIVGVVGRVMLASDNH